VAKAVIGLPVRRFAGEPLLKRAIAIKELAGAPGGAGTK
jgi:hypothetical protein